MERRSLEDLGEEVAFETAIVGEGGVTARPMARARALVEDLGGGIGLEMVVVPGGRFLMGAPEG